MKFQFQHLSFVIAIAIFASYSNAEEATLGASNDTYIREGRSHAETGISEFLDSRDSEDFVPYIQFDLSSVNIDTITDATLTLSKVPGSRNDNISSERFAAYGLPDLANNTLQTWDELADFDPTDATNGLDWRNVGDEWNRMLDNGVDRSLLISLDPEDGTPDVTETISGGQMGANGTIEISGAALVSFLNDRADANGLVTFVFPLEGGGADRGYGIGSKENGNPALQPSLFLNFTTDGETAELGPSNDTYIREGQSHVETGVSEFLDSRDVEDFVPYIQFDLSALEIDSITNATLTLFRVAGSRNDTITSDRFATYGLPNMDGNTLQTWDELADFDPSDATNGLDWRNVGADWNRNFESGIDRSVLVSLDPQDGTSGVSESINATTGEITVSGDALVEFLNARVDDNGRVTFLIPLEAGGVDRGYGIASRDNPDMSLRPSLSIVFTTSSGGILVGDVNCDDEVNLLDVAPFVDLVISGGFSEKADINADGLVDLLDVAPFVDILTGG